jgi:nucleoside-diphosphate-sugar epimerase
VRVLVTGHNGYIGSILTGMLVDAGHEVVGFDNFIFESCTFGAESTPPTRVIRKDIRDIELGDLEGINAICHLAGISNDPVGDLDPRVTQEINHLASVRVAELAVRAGVQRFVFSSSCSIYGASPSGWVDEESAINPVTPYGWSKINVERDVSAMASENFSPVFLRNATAYGLSPRLRADLVINNMMGYAVTQGRVVMKSDGTPWRPLVHVEDISRAFLAVIEAPREAVHNQVFNVGSTEENYRIRDVASIVEQAVPGVSVVLADNAGPDLRDYRVNCDKIRAALPGFKPAWSVPTGADELHGSLSSIGLAEEEFFGPLLRIEHIKREQAAGRLDLDLRVVESSND